MNVNDYIKIQKEATRLQVSPYLLIKRKINYRLCGGKEIDCRFCENFRNPKDKKKYCEIIGLSFDFYANVDGFHICDFYEPVKSKIDCDRDHNYINFIKQEEFKNERKI